MTLIQTNSIAFIVGIRGVTVYGYIYCINKRDQCDFTYIVVFISSASQLDCYLDFSGGTWNAGPCKSKWYGDPTFRRGRP